MPRRKLVRKGFAGRVAGLVVCSGEDEGFFAAGLSPLDGDGGGVASSRSRWAGCQ